MSRTDALGYRHHLRTVLSATAAPYGYTLALWTAGAITTREAGEFPTTVDALLLVAGAITAFAALAASAFGGLDDVLKPTSRAQVRVWGGLHLVALGLTILVVAGIVHAVHGHLVWPLVGFAVTGTYLVSLAGQYWLASRS